MSIKLDRLVKEKQMLSAVLENRKEAKENDPLNVQFVIEIQALEDRIKKINRRLVAYV